MRARLHRTGVRGRMSAPQNEAEPVDGRLLNVIANRGGNDAYSEFITTPAFSPYVGEGNAGVFAL